MSDSRTAQRIRSHLFIVVFPIVVSALLTNYYILFRCEREIVVGSGRAYAILGSLPVKHLGRTKPFNSLATEEIKLIHGSSTIKLVDTGSRAASRWEPVAALLDWSARPEFWDVQDFILIEYPALKQLLLQDLIREQLHLLACKESRAVRVPLEGLATQSEVTEADLRRVSRLVGGATSTANTLKLLASKFGNDCKWLSPHLLETTQLRLEGRTLKFTKWVYEILDKKERIRSSGLESARILTPLEEKAIEVGERFFHYKAIRQHQSPAIKPLDLQVVPRPYNEKYLKYSTTVFNKGMKSNHSLSPLENDVANSLVTYLEGCQSKEWALPGEDAEFDQKFGRWLEESSPWISLGVIFDSDESELLDAGLPPAEVVALRENYRDLETAEREKPGNLPEAIAIATIAAAHNVGTSLGNYPDSVTTTEEARLNQIAPFSRAPFAYACSLVLLLVSLGITRYPRSFVDTLRVSLYSLGIAGLLIGIALGLYGFWARFRITHSVPATTIYETVLWFALAVSILGLALELLWRKKYSAIAASGIGMVATFLAENTGVLDPHIRTVLPVLRMNRRLVGHVLTTITSYAAFALALGLGLLALGHYLTATYRRSPTYRELARPLLPGILLYALGRIGMNSTCRLFPLSDLHSAGLSYASTSLASIGGVLTIVGGLSLAGEFANRSPRRAWGLGAILAVVGSIGPIALAMGVIQEPLASAINSREGWLISLLCAAFAAMSLLKLQTNEEFSQIEALSRIIYFVMLIGALFLAAGILTGSAWARVAWGAYWQWDPKEIWAVITFLVYLVPLLGRFAGWISTFGLVTASVVCFTAILISWYGLNFLHHRGMHDYGFTEGGDPSIVIVCALGLFAIGGAAAWRRSRSI